MDVSQELGSVLKAALLALLGETPDAPLSFLAEPPAPPQPAAAATPAFVQPPPPMAAPPIMIEAQAGTGSQGQCIDIPTIPDSVIQHLRLVRVLNGVLVYDTDCAAPQLDSAPPPKRKRQDEQDRPYIIKPPNAFMLFLKEQRPKVVAACGMRGSAAVNAVVGKRWKSLSKDQQAVYFKEAEVQRVLHAQQHPQWSTKNNYGTRRKRVRASTCSTASAPPSASC